MKKELAQVNGRTYRALSNICYVVTLRGWRCDRRSQSNGSSTGAHRDEKKAHIDSFGILFDLNDWNSTERYLKNGFEIDNS